MTTKTRQRTVTAATPPEAPPEPTTTDDAPADPMPTSGMVCLLLDDDTVTALQTAVPPPEGATIPAPPHITLNFLGDVSALDRTAVEAAINAALSGADTEEDTEEGGEGSPADTDTVTGVFGGWGRFAAESDDNGNEEGNLTPIVALFDSPDLDEIQAALENVLEAAGMPEPTHGFTAHSTLCRVALGDTDTIAFPAPLMLEATFSEIALVWGDYTDPANITMFPIAGAEAPAPEAEPAAPEPATAMGLATDAPPDAPAPEPQPDEERTIPVPGPLGMFEACLVTEGVATDEVFETDESSVVMGRLIPEGVLTWRTPPLPGGFAVNDVGSPADNGHMGAPVACAATEIVREGNRIMARGPYLDNADGMALKAAVDGGAPIAPSIDLGASDQWEVTTEADGTSRRTLAAGSIAGFVVLPYEAQHSTESGEWLTWFRSAPDTALTPPEAMPEEMPALVPVAASACPVTWESLVACGSGTSGPVHPPAEWFQPPEMDGPTALHVTEEGRVWGHLAGPGCHIGMPDQCVTVAGATSKDFTQFHHAPDDGQGIVLADGSRLRVGALTLAGGHADLRASAREAKAHYDESRSVVAFLRASWDEKNNLPAIAGSLLPNVPEDKIQILRALGQSGDWREPDGSDWRAQEVWRTIDGKPTLIAATVVPVEGFPKLSRALAAGGFIEVEIVDTALALTASSEMAITGAADLPIAPRDTTWDAAGASKRLAALCTKGDTLDPGCFGRGFFYRDDSQPDTNVGSYSLPFADVINGKLQAVYAGVAAGAGRLDQADIPADAKEQIRGRMSAYYKRFAEAFSDPTVKAPWDKSESAVAADGLLLDLARDMYIRQLGEVASVLASAHEREAERLGASLR